MFTFCIKCVQIENCFFVPNTVSLIKNQKRIEVNKNRGKGAAKSNPSPLFRNLKFGRSSSHLAYITPCIESVEWSSSNGKATFFPYP